MKEITSQLTTRALARVTVVAMALTLAGSGATAYSPAWADDSNEVPKNNGETTSLSDRVQVNIATNLTSQCVPKSNYFDRTAKQTLRAATGHLKLDLSSFDSSGQHNAQDKWWEKLQLIDPFGFTFGFGEQQMEQGINLEPAPSDVTTEEPTRGANPGNRDVRQAGVIEFDITWESIMVEAPIAPEPGSAVLQGGNPTRGGDGDASENPVDPWDVIILWTGSDKLEPEEIWTAEGMLNEDAIAAAGGRIIYDTNTWRTLLLSADPNSDAQTEFQQALIEAGKNPGLASAAYFDSEIFTILNGFGDDIDDIPDDELAAWVLVYDGERILNVFPGRGLSRNSTQVIPGSGFSTTLRGNPMTIHLPQNQPDVGEQTGTGVTELYMQSQLTGEFGGTEEPVVTPAPEGTDPFDMVDENGNPTYDGGYVPNPLFNPDGNNDGLGDNIAFTVPTAINYVVNANGSLLGPTNAYICNESVFGIHVSSMQATPEKGWHFVRDAANAGQQNAVSLRIGVPEDMLASVDHISRKAVNAPGAWKMGTSEEVSMFTHFSDLIDENGKPLEGTNVDDYETNAYVYIDGDYLPYEPHVIGDESMSIPENIDDTMTLDNKTFYRIKNQSYPNGLLGGQPVYEFSYCSNAAFAEIQDPNDFPTNGDIEVVRVIFNDKGAAIALIEWLHASWNDGFNNNNLVIKYIHRDELNRFRKKVKVPLQKKLFLSTDGTTSHVSEDLTTKHKFGELRWYVSSDSTKVSVNYSVFPDDPNMMGALAFDDKPTGTISETLGLELPESIDADDPRVSEFEISWGGGGYFVSTIKPYSWRCWIDDDSSSSEPSSFYVFSGEEAGIPKIETWDDVISSLGYSSWEELSGKTLSFQMVWEARDYTQQEI